METCKVNTAPHHRQIESQIATCTNTARDVENGVGRKVHSTHISTIQTKPADGDGVGYASSYEDANIRNSSAAIGISDDIPHFSYSEKDDIGDGEGGT